MISIDEQVVTVGLGVLAGIGTIVATVWKHSQWLGNQFSSLKDFVEKKTDELREDFADQLKYHERHDDQRFSDLNKSLQNIQWQASLRDYNRVKSAFDQEDEDYQPRTRE